jgi:hypothetical protein
MSNLARRIKVGNTGVSFYPELRLVVGGEEVTLKNASSEQRKTSLAAVVQGGEKPEEIYAASYREGAAWYWEFQARKIRIGEIQSGRVQWREGTNFLEVVEAKYHDETGKGGYARFFLVIIKTPEG